MSFKDVTPCTQPHRFLNDVIRSGRFYGWARVHLMVRLRKPVHIPETLHSSAQELASEQPKRYLGDHFRWQRCDPPGFGIQRAVFRLPVHDNALLKD